MEVEVGSEVAVGSAVGSSVGGGSVTLGSSRVGMTVGCSGATNVDETTDVAAGSAFAWDVGFAGTSPMVHPVRRVSANTKFIR